MLKRSFRKALLLVAGVAAAVTWTVPAAAQGTSGQLDAAEKKLDEDIRACRPINVGEYTALADETGRNVNRAKKVAQSGVPVDSSRMEAENDRAQKLLKRAQAAAAASACPPKTQQQAHTPGGQVNPPPPPPPPVNQLPGPNVIPRAPNEVLDQISDEAGDAEDDFYLALRHCDEAGMKRALAKFEELAKRAREIAKAARTAQRAGFGRIDPRDAEDLEDDLLDFIDYASVLRPRCPVPAPKPQVSPCPPGTKPLPTSTRSQWTLDRPSLALLTYHNFERAEIGVPKLRWNDMLATHAQSYANQLAQTGELAHAPREGRGIERENLSRGLIGWNAGQMMQNWSSEKRFFMPGTFPNVSSTGDWSAIAHYSQIIWPTTTDLGCGMAMGHGYQWLVCRYSPGGNRDGKPVGYPTSDCSPALPQREPGRVERAP